MKSVASEKTICDFSESILPYLYGESSDGERDRFDAHLAECSICTDEFADLSFSRYSVFVWQKEEFAPMPTPQFTIPYDLENAKATGFLTGFRELISFNWATAAGAFAVIVVVIGLGFFVINYPGNPESQLAGIDETNKNISVVKPASSPLVPAAEQKVEVVTTAPQTDSERNVVPIRASVTNRRQKQRSTSISNAPRLGNAEAVRVPQPQDRRTPSLTAGTDEDDRSLRLTDLFDSVDTRL